jgi:hypothetical protein
MFKTPFDIYKQVKYIPCQAEILEDLNFILNENAYVPRFSLKNDEIFPDCPVNEPIKYSDALCIKAIKYGMIFLVNYKGEKDKSITGSERVTYFMVLGKSSKNRPLLRVYHLKGWSVSENNNIEKTWRMFRTDRILSMTFTGMFFRLPPEGYKAEDKGMVGGIIAAADFSVIRRNQEELVRKMQIEDADDVNVTKSTDTKGKRGVYTNKILVKDTNSEVDVLNVMDNAFIAKIKDIDNLRITFLKSVYKNKRICILGAIGEKGKLIDIKVGTGSGTGTGSKTLGIYKVLDSITGSQFKKIKNIKGDNLYALYIFDKKIKK